MLTTLSRKLAAVLLLLFCLVGGLFLSAMVVTTRLHNQEITQRFNLSLASNLAADRNLMREGKVDEEAVAAVFHMLMVVNPNIELYLLDGEGRILSFSAPPGKVRRERVDLGPLRRLLAGGDTYPVLGDDPRDPRGRKVFSVAPVRDGEEVQGYLYVILGGEEYESLAQIFRGSYILRLSLMAVGGGLIFALLAGVLLFHQLTRRLRHLAADMDRFRLGGFEDRPPPLPVGPSGGDEISRLSEVYALMAARIGAQIGELKKADETRRELVTNVSHDLRTPLASLKGFLETLSMKGAALSAGEREDYLRTAMDHTAELERRVDGLMELSRLESPGLQVSFEDFPVHELAEALVQRFAVAAAARGVGTEARYPDGLSFVHADIELITRVLENLMENALRHTGSGGRVVISLEYRDGRVEIRVTDTGSGIRKEDLEKIFERHFSAPGGKGRPAGRAGLGLAICRKIVELHGGDLSVESEEGKGTAFFFSLPSTTGDASPAVAPRRDEVE